MQLPWTEGRENESNLHQLSTHCFQKEMN